MTEDDMLLEAKKSQEIATLITTGRRPLSASRIQPKRATQGLNKQQRIDSNRYKNELVINDIAVNASLNSNFNQNQNENIHPNITITSNGNLRVNNNNNTNTTTNNIVNNDTDEITKAMKLLQTKYEKNLEVIDILFHEKKKMESKINDLESKISYDSNKFDICIGNKTKEECDNDRMIYNNNNNKIELKELHAPKFSEETITPSMAVSLFGDQSINNNNDNNKLNRKNDHIRPPLQRGRKNDITAVSMFKRSQDDINVSNKSKTNSETQRSISCDSRKSIGSFNQSIQMQASIDRYIQRKLLLEQKEKAEQLEQKVFEQQQRERYLRVF